MHFISLVGSPVSSSQYILFDLCNQLRVVICDACQNKRLAFAVTFTKTFLQIGQYIASNGGVVTAEELAPYLDVETTENTVYHTRHIQLNLVIDLL